MKSILNLAVKLLLPTLFLLIMVLIAGNLTAEEPATSPLTTPSAPGITAQN